MEFVDISNLVFVASLQSSPGSFVRSVGLWTAIIAFAVGFLFGAKSSTTFGERFVAGFVWAFCALMALGVLLMVSRCGSGSIDDDHDDSGYSQRP